LVTFVTKMLPPGTKWWLVPFHFYLKAWYHLSQLVPVGIKQVRKTGKVARTPTWQQGW
jgi:hypothetical protein